MHAHHMILNIIQHGGGKERVWEL